jgi:hypothetical protein
MKRLDLTGQTFSKLTVVSFAGLQNKRRMWNCDCACGSTKVIAGNRLRNGGTRSCGCLPCRVPSDLTGQIFDRLTAVKFMGIDKNGQPLWACDCSCGKATTTTIGNLRSGNTKSCGCLRGAEPIDMVGRTFGDLKVLHRTLRCRTTGGVMWACICVCGNTPTILGDSLRNGDTKSCGCLGQRNWKRHRDLINEAVVGQTINGRRCEAYVGRDKFGKHSYRFVCDDCGVAVVRDLPGGKKNKCRCHPHNTLERQMLVMWCDRLRVQFAFFLKRTSVHRVDPFWGCSPQQAKTHIESKFLPGMTWENRRTWDIDHINPLRSAATEAEAITLFALENLQPLWKPDHRRKSMAEWTRERHRNATSLQSTA